jgi:type I site-specific restriction endonuclease
MEIHMSKTEAFARTLIDAQLDDQGWKISDGISVRYEYTLRHQQAIGIECT